MKQAAPESRAFVAGRDGALRWVLVSPGRRGGRRRSRPRRAAAEPAFRDVAREAGITFQHHAAPEKKYIVESMSGGVALLDFDNDGLVDIYLTDSLTVDTAKDPKAARSALYRNLGNGKFEDVTDKAGVGHPGWAMGVCTADVDGDGWEDIYVTGLGRNYLYRNNHDGTFTDIAERVGRRRRRLVGRLRLRRLRPGRRPRPLRQPLREDRPRATCPSSARARPASIAASRCSAGRAACPASRTSCSTTTATGASPRWARRRASRDPRELLRPGRRLVRLQRRRLAGPLRGQRLRPELPLPEPEGRHVQGGRLPHGRGGERGRRRAGQHGRGRGRLRQRRPPEPLRDELRRGVQRPLPQRRRPLHRRLVPLEDRAQQPALRGLGHVLLRLRQRRAGWTSSRSTATSIRSSTRRAWAPPPATGSGKLLYHNRGDGTFDEVAAQFGPVLTEERVEPRPGRGRPRQRRPARRRDQRPRRRARRSCTTSWPTRATGCS